MGMSHPDGLHKNLLSQLDWALLIYNFIHKDYQIADVNYLLPRIFYDQINWLSKHLLPYFRIRNSDPIKSFLQEVMVIGTSTTEPRMMHESLVAIILQQGQTKAFWEFTRAYG